jgi:L-lactate dehydrogenase complex protein LldF
MRIPLPKLMRHWREREFEQHLTPKTARAALRLWAYAARHPTLYRLGARLMARILGNLGIGRGRFRRMPFAGGWTRYRDFPAPEGKTFQQLWAERKRAA